MTKFPESTYRILACQEFTEGVFDTDLIVDWAIEMLEHGYETDSLLILAGMPKPVNSFEVFPYLSSALKELGLKPLTGDDAIIAYIWTVVCELIDSESVGDPLYFINDFYEWFRDDDAKVIQGFCRLYYAWSCFDNGEQGVDMDIYWKGVTEDNLEQLLKDYAKDWCKQHRPQLPF